MSRSSMLVFRLLPKIGILSVLLTVIPLLTWAGAKRGALQNQATIGGGGGLSPVFAEYSFAGQVLRQYGQGWIIGVADSSQKFLIMPAHVGFGAERVWLKCRVGVGVGADGGSGSGSGGQIPLKLRGQSAAYDIALFDIPPTKDCPLAPMFVIRRGNDHQWELVSGSSVDWRSPGAGFRFFAPSTEQFVRVVDWRMKERRDLAEVVPYEHAILAYAAIRPGMSGSPLYDGNSPIPVGMAIKTRLNSNQSIVIPFAKILELLPALWRGQDPWQGTESQTPVVEFFVDRFGGSFAKAKAMVVRTLLGTGRLRDLCPSASFQMATDWIAQGGSWADGGGGQQPGDGRAAEYTGGSVAAVTTSNARLFPIHTYYRLGSGCAEEGVALSDGRILIGIKDAPGTIYRKIGQVADLLPDAQRMGSELISYINKYGLFKKLNDNDFTFICNTTVLGPGLRAVPSAGSEQPHIVRTRALSGSLPHSTDALPFVMDSTWVWSRSPRSGGRGVRNGEGLVCKTVSPGPANNVISIRHESRRFAFSIDLTPGAAVGSLVFAKNLKPRNGDGGNGELIVDRFAVSDGKVWDHVVRTENGMTVLIFLDLDVDQRLQFRLSVMDVPDSMSREISDGLSGLTPTRLWLLNYSASVEGTGGDQ